MKSLAIVLGILVCGPSFAWSPAYGFFLDAAWTEERDLEYPLYTEEGRCLLGKTTVMRNQATREWRGVFTPFDNDAIALSGGTEGEGDAVKKTVKLEQADLTGTYADFRPTFQEGQCTAFTLVLFDERDQELARHEFYRDHFETLVLESETPAIDRCRAERVSETVMGRWRDFTCEGPVTEVFQFSPFAASEPLVKVWHEQRSEDKNDLDVYFALKTRAGRWARTRMIDDTQLLWDILKNADDDIVAFEVTLRDTAGRAFVRRMYDKDPGE